MQGRMFKQVVRGHVIRPAQIMESKTNNREFLAFSIAVDNLVEGSETGFINCTYWPFKDRALTEDVVACALSWISTDEQPGLVTADGFQYKRVEVTVEGQISLRKVEDSKGYYVNLSYCTVDIHDSSIVFAVRDALGLTKDSEQKTSKTQSNASRVPLPGASQVQTPTVAPTVAPVVSAPAPVNVPVQPVPGATGPQEGSIVQTADGTVYRIENGTYVCVGKLNTQAAQTVQAPTTVQPSTTPNSLGEMLGSAANVPSTNFGS